MLRQTSAVDHGDPPVLLGIAQDLRCIAETRDDAVGIGLGPVIQEKLLDNVRLITKAQNKILVTKLAIIIHQVPEDWPIGDRDHRFGDALRIFADAGT